MILISVLIVVLSYLFYRLYVLPKKMMNSYLKDFQKTGYRVKMYPYNPIKFVPFMLFIEDYEKHGDCLKSLRTQFKDCDVFISNIGAAPFIRLFSPQLIRQFCNKQRQFHYEKNKTRMKFLNRLTGQGIFDSQGQQWKNKRKILNKVFTFDFIKRMVPKILSVSREVMDKFDEKSQRPSEISYKVCQMTQNITSRIIFENFLGGQLKYEKIQDQDPADCLTNIINAGTGQIKDPLAWIFGPSFLNLGLRQKDRKINQKSKVFDEWARSYLKLRIQEEQIKIKELGTQFKPNNVIGALVQQSLHTDASNRPYNLDQILSEFKSIFLAGTDTTAHLVEAMIYFISKNPSVEKKLRQQINKLDNIQLSQEDIKKLPYLQCVQKEALRMCGPANIVFSRTVIKDHELNGVKIYSGSSVQYLSAWAYYSQEYYKEPESFRPERWQNGQSSDLNPYAHVSFHSGARTCLGKQLAMLQSKIMMVQFMRRYSEISVIEQKVGLKVEFVFQTDNYHVKLTRKESI